MPGTMGRRHAQDRAFIGREAELLILRRSLDDASSGRGRIVLVAGEPGIGKTRLAQELVGIALASGVRVAWGRCNEGLGAPPLWPWREVIRSLDLADDEVAAAGVDAPPGAISNR